MSSRYLDCSSIILQHHSYSLSVINTGLEIAKICFYCSLILGYIRISFQIYSWCSWTYLWLELLLQALLLCYITFQYLETCLLPYTSQKLKIWKIVSKYILLIFNLNTESQRAYELPERRGDWIKWNTVFAQLFGQCSNTTHYIQKFLPKYLLFLETSQSKIFIKLIKQY